MLEKLNDMRTRAHDEICACFKQTLREAELPLIWLKTVLRSPVRHDDDKICHGSSFARGIRICDATGITMRVDQHQDVRLIQRQSFHQMIKLTRVGLLQMHRRFG